MNSTDNTDGLDPTKSAEGIAKKLEDTAYAESVMLSMGHLDESQVTVRGRGNVETAARGAEQKKKEQSRKLEEIIFQRLMDDIQEHLNGLQREINTLTSKINNLEQEIFDEDELKAFKDMSPEQQAEHLKKLQEQGKISQATLDNWILWNNQRTQKQETHDRIERKLENATTPDEYRQIAVDENVALSGQLAHVTKNTSAEKAFELSKAAKDIQKEGNVEKTQTENDFIKDYSDDLFADVSLAPISAANSVSQTPINNGIGITCQFNCHAAGQEEKAPEVELANNAEVRRVPDLSMGS